MNEFIGTLLTVCLLLNGTLFHLWGEKRFLDGIEQGRREGRLIRRHIRRGSIYRVE